MVRISRVISILSYAIILCGAVPLFPWLDTLAQFILTACFAAGLWQDRFGTWVLKNWMLNVSLVPLFLYYASQLSRSNAAQPVASLLAIMLAVRLLSPKSGRHYLQIQALSLFCLSASTLFDLSPIFLVYLCLMMFMVAVLLVLITFYDDDSRMQLSRVNLRRVVYSGLIMPVAAMPLLLLFFFMLPRTPLPLWNFLNVPANVTTALSDKVEPGSGDSTGESMSLAFRAEMPRLPEKQLYWRGTVFNRLEGKRWLRDVSVPPERLSYGSPRVVQMIFQEPGLSRFLIALDAPASVLYHRVKRNPDGTFEQMYAGGKRIAFQAYSHNSGATAATGVDQEFYRRLPPSLSPRIRQLAEGLSPAASSPVSRLAAAETYFRRGGYSYSMHGLPTGDNALEQFLFEKKPGNCEFFASAFAILLRGAGVPARLVGGYLGGVYNDLGGYYQVTDKMAHVWVEAYLEGRGWVRVDPSSFAVNADAVWQAAPARGFWTRFSMVLDSLDHVWNRSVVSYDLERQMEMAVAAGRRLQSLKSLSMPDLSFRLPILVSVVAAALFFWLKRKSLFRSREERVLAMFLDRVGRDCRLTLIPGRQGLYEIAALSGNEKAIEFVHIYGGAVYRDRRLTPQEYAALKLLLKGGFRG